MLLLCGCEKGVTPPKDEPVGFTATTSAAASGAPSTAGKKKIEIPQDKKDSRFMKIRTLLEDDPNSPERAMQLYPLVEPICADEKERKDFVAVAQWSSSFSVGYEIEPTVLALDTIEHVATSCFRNYPEAGLDILAQAKTAIPKQYRFDVITARLLASAGKLDEALKSAKAAAEGGSVHAIALLANIQAQLGRDKGVGYTAGMLEDAIKTVSVEPNEKWQLIDLTAVLSTRAHLLTERAAWEPRDKSIETRRLAATTYRRLAVAPFIEATRNEALDTLCFDSVEIGDDGFDPCKRAVAESGNLGAAIISKAPRDAATVDLDRLARIEKLRDDLKTLKKGSVVALVFRGDELELITWARPAARAIAAVARTGAHLVVVDRTRSARASALVSRILEIAEAKPYETARAQSDTLLMPCVAAILAQRKTPASCPLDKKQEDRLSKAGPFALALLVGRDLDAEIDDLKLYQMRSILLSFRQTRIEKALDAELKSLSDVWILAPREEAKGP